MRPNAEVAASLDGVLERLLRETKASRTTIRLDVPSRGLGVDDVVAEALAPGEKSLRGQTSINQRAAPTVKWLERERRLLVQNDLADADPAAPPALVQVYGTKAQMLGPLFEGDHLFGWISVHYNLGPRQWQQADIAALERAVAEARRELA